MKSPANPITVVENGKAEMALFKLGQAISDYHGNKNPDPFESKRQVKDPLALLRNIRRAVESLQRDIEVAPSFERLRKIFSDCGIELSEGVAPLTAAQVRVFALVAWGDFIAAREHTTPDGYAAILASLDARASGPIEAKLAGRLAIAELLEKRILVLDEQFLHLNVALQRWLAKHELCRPIISEDRLRNYFVNKRSREDSEKRKAALASSPRASINTPRDLYDQLIRHVVGQEDACKALATRGWLHMKRAELLRKGQNVGTNECMFFISQQSGVGKTFLAENYGRICSLPFTSFSSTDATSVGYVGLDIVEDALKSLLRIAGDPKESGTLQRAQHGGIIFYDEFTKKRTQGEARDTAGGRDVSGGAVQQEVLRLMEGCKVQIGNRRGGDRDGAMEVNTTGMMFIFGGYVEGFDKVISKLNRKSQGIGFGDGEGQQSKLKDAYLYDALVDYGFIPEFVNRLSKIVMFRKLFPADLVQIAAGPTGVIESYNSLLKPQGLTVGIADDGILSMAELCVETGLMARGLRLIVNSLVEDAVFNQAKGEIMFSKVEVRRAMESVISLGV